jgi:hypothetical protein
MGLLMVVELIGLSGEVQILRKGDMHSSKSITVEALNLFDSLFFDISPDIREFKKMHDYSKDQVEDISRSMAKYKLKGKSREQEGEYIFLPI